MTDIMSMVSETDFLGMVFDWGKPCIFYAGRICDVRNWLYPGQKRW